MFASRKTIMLEVENEGEEALVRSYHAMLLEMRDLALAAPAGRVIDQLEDAVLEKGRETLRATLEHSVQERIDAAEKKARRSGNARADRNAKTAEPPREDS